MDRLEKIGHLRPAPFQDIAGQLAIVRALLDDPEWIRLSQRLPHLEKLPAQQPAKQRPNTHTGIKIAALSNGRLSSLLGIVAEFRMIKRHLHKAIEAQDAPGLDFFANNAVQRGHGLKADGL